MPGSVSTTELEPERKDFVKLIIGNPNYFGNVLGSNLIPVKPMNLNASYEEIMCVGFNPDLNNLEAVVFIKRDYGYSGDICSSGSLEYVRFYLSYDNGKIWEDQGITSFKVYDIPGNKPLEYAVALRINPKKYLCRIKNLPLVRAILSWNVQSPANTPNYMPAWGNVKETSIQINPLRFIPLKDLLTHANVKASESFDLVDGMQSVNVIPPKALSISELPALYKGKNVPEHRYLFPELSNQLSTLHLNTTVMSADHLGTLTGLNINIQDILKKLMLLLGDRSYEELTCVGFDPIKNSLVGIITVKKPYGYIGGLCEVGSREFVAFWIDWGDGVWKWAGTTQVTVHDIDPMPAGGLQYAVFLPVDVLSHIFPCTNGATIARVRATLSWEVPPPPTNPEFVPTWGNRYETKIHVYPGKAIQPNDYTPFIQSICSIPVCTIDQKTGFTKGDDRPFGGSISISGFIPGAPDVNTPPANRPKYRISVRPVGSSNWQHLNDTLSIYIDQQIGTGMPTSTPTSVPVDVDSYYTYNESSIVPGVGWRKINPPGLLTVWNSAGKTGLWEIMIEAKNPVTSTTFAAGTINCVEDKTTRQNIILDLDQKAPDVKIWITDYDRNGSNNQAKNCDTFQVGDVIHGQYSVSDEHFGSLSLQVEPDLPGNTIILTPTSRSYPTVPTTGETGKWTLDTSKMQPCGYVVRIFVTDRTIVSCNGGWPNKDSVGFCLGAKK